MKSLFTVLSLALVPAFAHAYSVECSGGGVYYAFESTDGGAPREPSITLVHDGKVLVRQRMFEEGVHEGSFEFIGRPAVLKTRRPDRQHVVKIFEQTARVANKDGEELFADDVLCKSVEYVGPPRP